MDDENNNNTAHGGSGLPFSQSIALRIQKKVASKMSNKNMAKIFIDDVTGRLLDNVYNLVKLYTNSRRQADSILNDIIKIIVKIGILFRNDQLSQDELRLCNSFRQTFHSFVKSALSFYEIEYSFDKDHLAALLRHCQSTMQQVVKSHLTDKSKQRIDHVFNFFADKKFLEDVFNSSVKSGGNKINCSPNGKENATSYQCLMKSIVEDVRKLVDEGSL